MVGSRRSPKYSSKKTHYYYPKDEVPCTQRWEIERRRIVLYTIPTTNQNNQTKTGVGEHEKGTT